MPWPALHTASEVRLLRDIERGELELLATGAGILGAGGGGSPYLPCLNMRSFYAAGGRVALLDSTELADGDLVAVVADMGAPLVAQERLSDPVFAAKPVRMMEDYTGRPFRAVMAAEIGGGNAFQPLLVASVTGVPVVDADATGRAFPEAQMTSFAIADLPMGPLALADIRENEVIVTRAAGWEWTERVARKVCTEFGSLVATCEAPRSGAEVKRHGILRTVTQAIALGRAVHEARRQHDDPTVAAACAGNGRLLFRGKVVDVRRHTTAGFLRGEARIDGLDEDRGRHFEVVFQNEYLVGWCDDAVVVTSPDLICLLDAVSGEAIGSESLRYGQRIGVVALPSPLALRTPKALAQVGPRAFGCDFDYRPIFGEGPA